MRSLGVLLGALGVLFAAGATAQEPSPDKPLPPRDDIPDTTRTVVTPVPSGISPLAAPVRLDLSPQGVPPGMPWDGPRQPSGIPGAETVSSVLEPKAHLGDHDLDFRARYNRVEGLALHAGLLRPLRRDSYLPSYRLEIGFGFSADRGQYRVVFEQPVATRNKVTLGMEAYRLVLPFWYSDEALSSGENSASAFFVHRDYWDWYEAEGLRGFVGVRPSPFVRFTLGVVQRDETALANETDWSLFNQESDFRPNPATPDGEYRGIEAEAAFDSRPRQADGEHQPRTSWSFLEHWHRLAWERGDGGLGGDFDLWRVTADLRNYLRLTPNQMISTRLLAGTGRSRDGSLPDARRYALGGLGTLRGHLYRSVRGDRAAMANLQYAFGVGGSAWLLAFADAGTAWDSGSLFHQRVPVDLGAGFRLGECGPTLLVARTLADDAEFRAEFRFEESY